VLRSPQAILFRVARADGLNGRNAELVVRDDKLKAPRCCWSNRNSNGRSILPIALIMLDQGAVVYHAAASELLANNDIMERYCSV
jgi:hypothetical protein